MTNPLHELDPHRHMIVVRHPNMPTQRRLAIGYWSSITKGMGAEGFFISLVTSLVKGPLPHPSNFVDKKWDKEERKMVAKYLMSFLDNAPKNEINRARAAWNLDPVKDSGPQVIHKWMGYAPCRMCDKMNNGTRCIGDDKFIWPEGFAHYIEEHDVRPPREFIDHVRQKVGAMPRGVRV